MSITALSTFEQFRGKGRLAPLVCCAIDASPIMDSGEGGGDFACLYIDLQCCVQFKPTTIIQLHLCIPIIDSPTSL